MSEEEQVAEEQPEQTEERDWEEEARNQGWKPEEEWKGAPPKNGFTDAETFVKRGEEIKGFQVAKLQKEVDSLKKAQKAALESATKSLKQELSTLRAKQASAIESGDGQEFVRLGDEIDRKSAEVQQHEQQVSDGGSAVFQDFQSRNPWWGVDNALTGAAMGIAEEMNANQMTANLSEAAYYAELERRVNERFNPGNQNRERPAKSESATPPEKGGKKTLADLPADAQAAFKETKASLKDMGVDYTLDQYLAEYE